MTAQEFSSQFDLIFNNLMSNKAPEINEFEKSYYLTMAEEELVKDLYKQFEFSELVRRGCDAVIEKASISPMADVETTPIVVSGYTQKVFELPEDLWYIVHESALVKSDDPCYDGRYIRVKPERYDEIDQDLNNPFRRPDGSRAFRIDTGRELSRRVEVISKYDVERYSIQYIRRPKPILLVDLGDGEWADYGLHLRGETATNLNDPCELSSGVHNEIVIRAASMALSTYKGA
jgi:hypothetical protein